MQDSVSHVVQQSNKFWTDQFAVDPQNCDGLEVECHNFGTAGKVQALPPAL